MKILVLKHALVAVTLVASSASAFVQSGTNAVAMTTSGPQPFREAYTIEEAQPEYPESARDLNWGHAQVAVNVTIGPTGDVAGADIASSSGNNAIDLDALRVVRLTTYAPKLQNCQPVTSAYTYLVDYSPD